MQELPDKFGEGVIESNLIVHYFLKNTFDKQTVSIYDST